MNRKSGGGGGALNLGEINRCQMLRICNENLKTKISETEQVAVGLDLKWQNAEMTTNQVQR